MTEEEIAYKMPRVDTGCTVKIYPHGNETDTPIYAHVSKCADRSITAKSPFDQPRGGMRHISDPLLKNRDQAFRSDCGAWDFTDESKAVFAMKDQIAELTKRVKTLEELLEKKTK